MSYSIRLCDPGIIPAYAGSTTRVEIMSAGLEGSSPHTRGARMDGLDQVPERGIIPAYAGSTPWL